MDMFPLLTSTVDIMLLQGASSYTRQKHSDKEWRMKSVSTLEDCYHGIVRILGGETVFEIGAHQAAFSKRVRKKDLPEAQVFAFEANPYVYDRFKDDPDFLSDSKLHYLNLAVSDYDGTLDFDIVKTCGDSDVSNRRAFHSTMKRTDERCTYENLVVNCTTIDKFINDRNLKGQFHAWIDVEGASQQVLTGIGDSINNFSSFFIEVEDQEYWKGQWLWRDVLEFMLSRGFFPVKRDFQSRLQFNVIFVRQDLLNNPELRVNLTYYTLGV